MKVYRHVRMAMFTFEIGEHEPMTNFTKEIEEMITDTNMLLHVIEKLKARWSLRFEL